ncbi:MAG: zinc-dependent metalloprotease [Phycisphaerales bacterium]|jgi:hypothetical protein|nr:zinc-dependent metalloprotease [Phycisphaerales bacterium]
MVIPFMVFACVAMGDAAWAPAVSGGQPGVMALQVQGRPSGGPVHLEPWSPAAVDVRVEVHGREGSRPARLPEVQRWRGRADDREVLVSVDATGVRGFTLQNGTLRRITMEGDTLVEHPTVVWAKSSLPCGGSPAPAPFESEASKDADRAAGACRVLRVAFDSDWPFTDALFAGDADLSAAYVLELAAAVSVIYAESLDMTLEVAYVRTWSDEASCPYDPSEQSDTMLHQLQAEWEAAAPEPDRHVAHLLSGSNEPESAGQAWVSAVCGSSGYGFSSQLDGGFADPVVDHVWNVWDLFVVAHEIGHNLGADHTHEMVPPIDECGSGDCTNAWGGTIMSYCHTCLPDGMSNIVLVFHERVRADIDAFLNAVDTASCPLGTALPDMDGDGDVDLVDLTRLLAEFGACGGCACDGDLDQSGEVDVRDLLRMLEQWG